MKDCRFGQPYSLFHSLDLDWILKEIKALKDEGLTVSGLRDELQALIGSDSETVKNSDALGGTPAADYLKKTETAANSEKLGDYPATYYLSKQTALDTYLSKVTAAQTYLQKTATAADSSQLGGIPAADYLTESEADAKYALIGAGGGIADDSAKLGGIPAADYLTEAEASAAYLTKTSAANTYLTPTAANQIFLGKSATAADSSNLGGLPAADYLTESEANALYAPIGSGGGDTTLKTYTVRPNTTLLNTVAITAASRGGVLKVSGYFEMRQSTQADVSARICYVDGVKVIGNTYAVVIDHAQNPAAPFNVLLLTENNQTRLQFEAASDVFPSGHWCNFSIFSLVED